MYHVSLQNCQVQKRSNFRDIDWFQSFFIKMLLWQVVHFVEVRDKFYFRGLNDSVIKIEKATSLPLIFNHRKWIPSQRAMANPLVIETTQGFFDILRRKVLVFISRGLASSPSKKKMSERKVSRILTPSSTSYVTTNHSQFFKAKSSIFYPSGLTRQFIHFKCRRIQPIL